MYVQANEQITELLQQESFMERKMAAQREDIERLAARVEAAEARLDEARQECARLQEALRLACLDLAKGDDKGTEKRVRLYLDGAEGKPRTGITGEARPDTHPEETCDECGGPNPGSWSAPNDLWNATVGTPDNPRGEGLILCPTCFTRRVAAWPDTPADDEPCSCCDGEGCAYCTPADSQEDKT